MKMMKDEVVRMVLDLLREKGSGAYYGEPVTQTEHMVQTALWAEKESKGNSELITAALLHDVGHLLHSASEDVADHGINMRHELIGSEWLKRIGFKPVVYELVRLHVDAKRYLCSINPKYLSNLSPASSLSLSLQGGPMSSQEAEDFIGSEFGKLSLQIRSWDEKAKEPNLPLPPLDHFRPFLLDGLLDPLPSL